MHIRDLWKAPGIIHMPLNVRCHERLSFIFFYLFFVVFVVVRILLLRWRRPIEVMMMSFNQFEWCCWTNLTSARNLLWSNFFLLLLVGSVQNPRQNIWLEIKKDIKNIAKRPVLPCSLNTWRHTMILHSLRHFVSYHYVHMHIMGSAVCVFLLMLPCPTLSRSLPSSVLSFILSHPPDSDFKL